MLKIHILSRWRNVKYLNRLSFWDFFDRYKKELNDLGLSVSFFDQINNSFLKGDKLILNSKFFPILHQERLPIIKKIYKKNNNLIWYDMRDSSGNTQFDVLPYVNYYIKKQFLKNKRLYQNLFFNNRIYSDYYYKNYFNDKSNFKFDYNLPLDFKYINKLILGWNIGVKRHFDFLNFSTLKLYLCKLGFLNIENYLLDFHLGKFEPKVDINCEFGLHTKQNQINSNILYQRKILIDSLKKIGRDGLYIKKKNKKNYYKKISNTKLVIGSFGLGEICDREFEATLLGASFTTGNMSHLETWPNIYIPEITYLPLNWDMSNLNDIVDKITNNKKLHEKLVTNSQKILKDAFGEEGKNYFLKFCKTIFNI